MRNKMMTIAFILFAGLLGTAAYAQDMDAEKEALKKKIVNSIRRLDMRIDKIDHDMKNAKDEKAKASANEYRAGLVANKTELEDDIKGLDKVTKATWKDFKEEVEEHLDKSKESIKPVMM